MKNKTIKFALMLSLFGLILLPRLVFASDITPSNIISLTNQERQLRGLQSLKSDVFLTKAASSKSSVMISRNYFDHFAFGISPWVLIDNSGYNNGYGYAFAGENLAMDFNTAEGVVNAWMNSPAHRQNILNPNFEDTGIGVATGQFTEADGQKHQTIMVTQMFAKKKSVALAIASNFLSKIFGITNK